MAKQSGQRFIKRNRPPRVHITYEDPTNAEEKIELPFVMGVMGSLNILAAVWPSSETLLRPVRIWLPLEVSQGSRTLMLFTGVALLQVTRNLARPGSEYDMSSSSSCSKRSRIFCGKIA